MNLLDIFNLNSSTRSVLTRTSYHLKRVLFWNGFLLSPLFETKSFFFCVWSTNIQVVRCEILVLFKILTNWFNIWTLTEVIFRYLVLLNISGPSGMTQWDSHFDRAFIDSIWIILAWFRLDFRDFVTFGPFPWTINRSLEPDVSKVSLSSHLIVSHLYIQIFLIGSSMKIFDLWHFLPCQACSLSIKHVMLNNHCRY